MRLVHRSLVRATEDAADLGACGEMLAGASMGTTAFQKGLGAIHALSHPVGAAYHVHHGLTNAVVMPYVLAFNRPAIEERLEAAARYLGLEEATFDGYLRWILGLRQALDLPHTLAELGVREEDVPMLAERAAVDPTAGGNPVPGGPAELALLYRRCVAGDLERAALPHAG